MGVSPNPNYKANMEKATPTDLLTQLAHARAGEGTTQRAAFDCYLAYLRITETKLTDPEDIFADIPQFLADLAEMQAAFMTAPKLRDHLPHPGDRYFVVHGRTPGDDDDTVAVILVPHDSERTAWEIFVEDHLNAGDVVDAEKWEEHIKEHGHPPSDGIPSDWSTRDPKPGETTWDTWAYHNSEFEIPGPAYNHG